MEWRDEAVVLSARRHGESALIVHLMTAAHGRHAGLVPGGASARARGACQPGNAVACRWRARIADHLGTLTLELTRSWAGLVLDDPLRLSALGAACALVDAVLPEREPHPAVHRGLVALLQSVSESPDSADWGAAYVGWEVGLLAELGFGLDLDSCAATGARADLVWVSPRSGRAVSAVAGAPWRDRLLPLPGFLIGRGTASLDDIIAGLALTGHFLAGHGLRHDRAPLPAARERLVMGFRRLVV